MKAIDWSVHNKLPRLRAYLSTACSLKRVQKTCHHLQTSSEGAVGGTKRTKAAAALFWTWFGSAARWCRVQLQAKMRCFGLGGFSCKPRCKAIWWNLHWVKQGRPDAREVIIWVASLYCIIKGWCKFLFATKFTLIGPRPQRDQGGVDTGQCPPDTGVLGKAGLADFTRLSSTKKGGATAWCAIGPDETHDLNRRPLRGVVPALP